MPRKIGFTVVSWSGHEENYSAKELMIHAPTVSGWRSARFCPFPQEITLQMVERCHVKKLQLLAHQYLISAKVEFHIGDRLPEPASPQNSQQLRRLGYVSLSNNEKTGLRARELKSVHVDAVGTYLKLTFHRNHANQYNLYNQVALVAINILGDSVDFSDVSPISSRDQLIEQYLSSTQHSSALDSSYTGSKYESISPLDDLAFDMYQDPEVAHIIRLLDDKKQDMVRLERYDLAKKLKQAIADLQKVQFHLYTVNLYLCECSDDILEWIYHPKSHLVFSAKLLRNPLTHKHNPYMAFCTHVNKPLILILCSKSLLYSVAGLPPKFHSVCFGIKNVTVRVASSSSYLVQVFQASVKLLKMILGEFVSSHQLGRSEVSYCVEQTLPVLLSRTGETTPRLRTLALTCVQEIAVYKEVRLVQLVPSELVKPIKLSLPSRLALSRLQLLEKLLEQLGFKDSGFTLENVMRFLVGALEHSAASVRELAVRLVQMMYRNHGAAVLIYLPPDDASERKTLIYKNLFLSFAKIDGKLPDPQVKPPCCTIKPYRQTHRQPHHHPSSPVSPLFPSANLINNLTTNFITITASLTANLTPSNLTYCPMLCRCLHCRQVVEISSLTEHLLSECERRADFIQCFRCSEAVVRDRLTEHAQNCSREYSPCDHTPYSSHTHTHHCTTNTTALHTPITSCVYKP
uniref:Centrosomal protein of 104 kDa n=1 Tax=Astyanax mexicanus TaxID=7994 RepID=A0A8B9GPX0_ASTMX